MKQLLQLVLTVVGLSIVTCPAIAEAWTPCAEENQYCVVPGTQLVRYGADGRWTEKMVNKRIFCGNSVFGDPAPGIIKACYYQNASYPADRPGHEVRPPFRNDDHHQRWIRCAHENSFCKFDGHRNVKYGVGDRWRQKTARNGIYCGNEVFGDPAPGVIKECYYQEGGVPAYPSGRDDDHQRHQWIKCANENAFCRFDGHRTVRYGVGDRWNHKNAKNGVYCDNREFGDPAPGVKKECYLRID